MNRTLYKVVFNKHRNCMMAVAENAKREGKNTADTQAAGISPNDISGFTGFIHSISVISFSLSLLLGSALILTSPSANAQGIVADKSAPVQQQPTIMQTGNGIPQANIQTPTAAGVSVNQYTHFNIDNRGAILNNSRRNVQTQLGGWIQGNPYLAGGEARVIVNQVNSANPSLLGGYIEVGGRRAEVVVANPAGIQVNGGGFINASRATLTTGQPQYQARGLSGFKMRQGNVVIAGHGLDARDTDYTQILSRAVKIDGPVWGKDVRVLAGQNDVSADGSIQSSHSPAANTNSANSLYAIDTGALGGMYAGKITLISTDRDASVRNQGQLFASAGNVAVNAEGKLANTGTIAATGENHAVSLHARNVRNSGTIASQDAVDIRSRGLDNRNGSVTAAGVLSVDSRNIDNRNGSLLSVNNTQLTVSDDLDNRHGEIATNRQLSIHDKNQNTLALNNADGTIQSAGNISLQAKSLANNGTLTAGNKLDIALADDFVVERDLTAGNQLNLSTKGRLKNTHTLQAGHTLKLNAGNIDNQGTGKIIAGEQTNITSEQHVENRGLINSNGLTHIDAGQTLNNTGTGKIYGNHIALDAQKLLNREKTTEGSTKAGAIAARKRLDIGAKEIHNQEGALLSSEGIFAIGNRLDEQHHAAGMADTFVNGSASLEVQGDALMSVRNMQNINNHFKTETYLAKAEKQVRDYTVLGQNTYYQAGKDGLFDNSQGQKDQTTATFHLKNGSRIEANQWHVRDYHIETYKERIIENRPAHITVGGNLTVSGQDWLNKDSQIIVGGRIITDDLNQKEITNQSTTGKGRTDAVGTQWDSVTKKGWYSGRKRQRRTERNHTPYHDTQLFTHDFDTPASVIQQNAASPSFQPAASAAKLIDGASTAAVNGQRIHTGNVVSLNNATVTLPNSSLYTTHPDNKGWLVETDPQFTDYRRWLGSDYMLKQLQLDPNYLHKRLGDGYYEQKLVNEQIHQLTGYRRLDGYSSDEEQFKALMDNGLTVAKTFGLTPGIALSAEQVARLTSDIVWMENQTVTLSDGSTQTVLAPKVYALARKGDLNTSGGLISAEQVLLKLQNGNLTNSGTIAGRQAVLIQARNINSNGNIQADQIGLKAEKSINVDGGQVQAGRLLTAQAQNINLNGTTQTSGNERNGNTAIDRMAGINVVGSYTEQVDNRASDGILSLHADNNINLNAATISNQVKGGTTQITAGNNLNLGTIRTEHREAYGALDDKNHRHVRQSAEVGSSIRTQNGAMLRAGNDLKIRQGELETEEGKTVLAAGRDVNISEGRQITELDAAVSVKRKGILSSTKTHDRYRFSHDEAVGSNIGGGKIIVAAGQDINVRGSNLISDNGTVLKAGNDIDISTAHNRYTGNEYHESKKSGVMGTGGLGFTIGNRKTTDDTDRTNIVHTGSIIGSLNGDTVTVAGNRYRQTGSTVSSPEGRNTITAKSIDVESANNRYATDYVHTREQKGLTIALNVPVVQAAQNFVQAAQNVGKSKNKRVNAMAAANAAWQGYQAAQQMQQFAPSSSAGQGQNNNQSSGISVSITYGEQKSRNEQKSRYTEAAASQIIGKGQTTLVATGGGEQSNINITGSDVISHAGTTLIADNHIKLQSAKQDGSEQSKNKSSGWNAGVAIQIGDGISLGITAGGNIGKGKGQGESITHRHTHVGSTAGKTIIRSGGDTTLKGAQLIGKGVQADTRNLHIESVQDTETYQSKQQNGNVQVTVGYGFSAGGSYSQSKIKADHASVTEQSGIYAGEDGYQIKVGNHTDLKGGIITSSQSAEDEGKNRFQTATLTASDIQNHSRYKGESFGLGASVAVSGKTLGQGAQNKPQNKHLTSVADKNGASSSVGYGSDSDSQSNITKSGINTRNIILTDEAGQLAKTGYGTDKAAQLAYTDIRTEDAGQQSGSLKNRFDADKVQSELDLQRNVSQQFAPVAAQTVAWTADKLGNIQNYERIQIAKANLQEQLKDAQNPEQIAQLQQQIVLADQYLSDHQTEYNTWKEGGLGRAALHAGVGALLTGDAQGAVGAGTSSLAAPYLNQVGDKFGGAGQLLADTLGGAAIGTLTGGSTGAAVAGANADWFNRQLHPDEVKWLHSKDTLQKYINYLKNKGLNLTPREAQIQLDRAAAAMVDSEWAILHGRNELAEQFLSQNTSRFHYVDNFGASHQFFTATNREYLDSDRNLKALFSAYTDKNEINKFLHSIRIENRNASTDFRRGMEQGYKDSSNDAHNDPKIIGKGIISLPRYVYDSSTSDEVGPLDDQQMETNRIALLRLQGRDYDAGRIYEYNHATQQRLMWYQLPVMELAGRIPSKLANKYKLYRAGKLSATQLAAEIKKQAPIVPNGKAFDFTSGTLIPNQTVKLTQAQNLSNGTTLPAGTIARLTGKGVEATLPNGKNVSYAGVTEQRALPAPRSPSLSSSLNGLSKSDQAIINHLAKDGTVLTSNQRPAIARTARDKTVNPIPIAAKEPEGRTISRTLAQNQAVQADAIYLKNLGATDIRINQQQVNGNLCRVGICRPDLQATLPSGKRVYIEYDRSTSSRGIPHADRIFSNDKDAIVILRTLD